MCPLRTAEIRKILRTVGQFRIYQSGGAGRIASQRVGAEVAVNVRHGDLLALNRGRDGAAMCC
jgi:hypothetical protein